MIRPLPRIKVCGVTCESDLQFLADARVDSVGINLVPRSPRYVDLVRAQGLCARAAELRLLRVGVVMDPEPSELRDVFDSGLFDFIQLHGTEKSELLASFDWSNINASATDLIKAVSWSGRETEVKLAEHWQNYRRDWTSSRGPELRAFLVDAYAPGQGGGTGRVARWDLLTPRPPQLSDLPLILAGGLVPSNVDAAIAATLPAGVDTASGVEVVPGRKSEELVHAFASNAIEAFVLLEQR